MHGVGAGTHPRAPGSARPLFEFSRCKATRNPSAPRTGSLPPIVYN